ncbi:HAMP domain-containing histidine kinase [Nitriliruptor alkaliphilus]|uniref:HAMP domain-containing histidine kinase n=1 Tax=Nitriliruptor alkaliphilus TaxID=427918 RepID=UPI000695C19D|nr:HAMP domain-containing histidine kinase [Nitriliruptor alkaliphilus]
MAIPLHLAVHLAGVAVAAGLALLVLLPPVGTTGSTLRTVLPPSARWSVAFGAGLLAGSHLVVGSLVAVADGWPLLVRAGGYAALAIGAAGGLARRPTLPPADGRFALTPVLLAVVATPAVLPLAAALAGAAACVATARGVLGRGRQVVLLVVGIALYAAADLAAGARPGLAAGLSLAGSLAAGSWVLRRAARRSLAGRFTGVSLVTLLALVVGLGAASGLVLASDVQAEQRDRLQAVAASHAADLVDRTGAALDATATAVAGATLVEPLTAGDTELAGARIASVLSLPEVEVAVLTDAAGALVAGRVRDGDGTAPLALATGNVIAGAAVTEAALAGQLSRGVIDLGNGSLLVVGAAPVAPRDDQGRPQLGRQVGALVLGRDLTSVPVVERIAADTATDATVIVGGQVVSTTLPEEAASLLAEDVERGTTTVGGVERVVAGAALGERGQLVLALPTDTATHAAQTATRSAFLLAVVGLAAAGALVTVLARRTADPVARLTAAAERVAAGDLDTRVAVERDDEVGRLAAAFDGMTRSLAGRDRDLRTSLAVQEALRDRLEAVTASMGEGLLATDAVGTVTTANPAAAEILEVSGSAALVGRPLHDVLRGQAEGGGDLVAALGGPDERGTTAARGELAGSGRVVEATAAPLAGTDAGTATAGRVLVVRDITARVLADRVRTEVIANLSHELNTPLTPIKAFLEVVAAHDGVEERFTPMLALARDGRARLERTISALVDLAELEAGRTPVTLAPLSPAAIASDLVERWRERVPGRTLSRRVRRGTPAALGDPALVGRVLDALVDNALKFSDGPVRITAEGDGDEVRVRVRDDGPGIPPTRRAEVLELFVQADGSSTRSVGGLGIGLPMAGRVADLLGGRLELDAAPGGGTDATLVLPAAPAGGAS